MTPSHWHFQALAPQQDENESDDEPIRPSRVRDQQRDHASRMSSQPRAALAVASGLPQDAGTTLQPIRGSLRRLLGFLGVDGQGGGGAGRAKK